MTTDDEILATVTDMKILAVLHNGRSGFKFCQVPDGHNKNPLTGVSPQNLRSVERENFHVWRALAR